MSLRSLAVWGLALAALYNLLVELPAPTFVVHKQGAIVVSGASSGIGLDAAIALVAEGFTVFAGIRKETDGAKVSAACEQKHDKTICSRLIPTVFDVVKPETIESVFATVSQWTEANNQPLVALFNNAGIMSQLIGPAEALDLQKDFRDVFEVNFFGLVALTQKFLPLIRASKGRIINHSSMAGIVGFTLMSAYSASKFAVDGFSDSLRKEVLPLGVSVSILDSGSVSTSNFTQMSSVETTNSPQILEIYRKITAGVDAKHREMISKGSNAADTTTPMILHAIQAERPLTRYFPASVGPVPSFVFAFVARVLPTNLFDVIILNA